MRFFYGNYNCYIYCFFIDGVLPLEKTAFNLLGQSLKRMELTI
jgi:hypothetical protein